MAIQRRVEGRVGAGVLMRLEPTQDIARKITAIGSITSDESDPTIYIHYFFMGCDWWAAEHDPKTGRMFGFANRGIPAFAKWGFFSIREMESISVPGGLMGVERELHWTPKPFSECGAVPEQPTGA